MKHIRKKSKFIDERFERLVIRHTNGVLCCSPCRLRFMKLTVCDINCEDSVRYYGRLLRKERV